jgi:hypothetical protein
MTAPSEPLAETALAFAREGMGRRAADTFTIGRGHRFVRNLAPGDVFNASDLNAVMAAVKAWCDESGALFAVHYLNHGSWLVEMDHAGSIPEKWRLLLDLDIIASDLSVTQHR